MTSYDEKLTAGKSAIEIATELAKKRTLKEAARSIVQGNIRDAIAATGAMGNYTDAMRIAAGALPAGLASGAASGAFADTDAMRIARGASPAVLNDEMRIGSPYSGSLAEAFTQMNTIEQLRKIGLGQTSALPSRSPISGQLGNHGQSKSEAVAIKTANDIGIAVRAARKANGLTQQQFADLAGVGRRFLSELETGKPTLEIGKVLKVTAAAGFHVKMLPARQTDE